VSACKTSLQNAAISQLRMQVARHPSDLIFCTRLLRSCSSKRLLLLLLATLLLPPLLMGDSMPTHDFVNGLTPRHGALLHQRQVAVLLNVVEVQKHRTDHVHHYQRADEEERHEVHPAVCVCVSVCIRVVSVRKFGYMCVCVCVYVCACVCKLVREGVRQCRHSGRACGCISWLIQLSRGATAASGHMQACLACWLDSTACTRERGPNVEGRTTARTHTSTQHLHDEVDHEVFGTWRYDREVIVVWLHAQDDGRVPSRIDSMNSKARKGARG
jgi:hypothetical protein